jgi:hypothetical protein
MFSTLGNVSFAASILFAVSDMEGLMLNLPWLIGSAGTVFFDFTVSTFDVYELIVDICAVLLVSETSRRFRMGTSCS